MANERMDRKKIAMIIAGGVYQLLLMIPFELNKSPRCMQFTVIYL